VFEAGDGARAAGARGGQRSGQARRRLTLEDVERDLPTLRTLEDAQKRLDVVSQWALAGLVTGVVCGSVVRACEVWIRAQGEQLDRDRVKVLEGRIAELEGELALRRGT